jgi:hypothetical protein
MQIIYKSDKGNEFDTAEEALADEKIEAPSDNYIRENFAQVYTKLGRLRIEAKEHKEEIQYILTNRMLLLFVLQTVIAFCFYFFR